MRNDEEYAKQRFDTYLRSIQPSASVVWRDGTQNIPPDFYLTYDEQEFVVEVTTIIEFAESDSRLLPRPNIDRKREEFLRDIEAKAKAQGILTGTYYVGFPLLDSTPDFLAKRKTIETALLAHIQKTQSLTTMPEFTIKIDGRSYCSILKTNNYSNSITVGVAPITMKWEGQGKSEACSLLQTAIDEKARKLAQFQEQKILLLLHSYPFVNIEYYRECFPKLNNAATFHTIFIVGGDREYVLYTSQPNWES